MRLPCSLMRTIKSRAMSERSYPGRDLGIAKHGVGCRKGSSFHSLSCRVHHRFEFAVGLNLFLDRPDFCEGHVREHGTSPRTSQIRKHMSLPPANSRSPSGVNSRQFTSVSLVLKFLCTDTASNVPNLNPPFGIVTRRQVPRRIQSYCHNLILVGLKYRN